MEGKMMKHRMGKMIAFLCMFAMLAESIIPGVWSARAKNKYEWIDAYMAFIDRYDVNYAQGFFFDIDHDRIPELIIDNGDHDNNDRSKSIYSYYNGSVKKIGTFPISAYIDYSNGYDGDLFGYYMGLNNGHYDSYMYRYKKDGEKITTKLERHIEYITNDDPVGYFYRKVKFLTSDALENELKVFGQASDYFDNPAGKIAELNELMAHVGSNFDYRRSGAFGGIMYNDSLLKSYRKNIIKYDTRYGIYYEPEDKNDAFGMIDFCEIRSTEMDWVFKNIFNISDKEIEAYKTLQNTYYADGSYYVFYRYMPSGMERAEVQEITKLGGVYHVRLKMFMADGTETPNDIYALVAEKTIDGKSYWSVYITGQSSLADLADKIDVGYKTDIKYKTYNTYALKAKSNGCYVTCDIGYNSGLEKFPDVDNPVYNVDAKKIQVCEMFDLVPLSDERYCALQMKTSRKYFSVWKNDKGELFIGCNDFATKETFLSVKKCGDRYKILCADTGMWLCVTDNTLGLTKSEEDAEEFDFELVSDNNYTSEEINILTNGELFNLYSTDTKTGYNGYGYWNMQYEIGWDHSKSFVGDGSEMSNTRTLEKLGYTMMTLNGNKDKTVSILNTQSAVGVKYEEGKYDVIITIQGTAGYDGDTEVHSLYDVIGDFTKWAMDLSDSMRGGYKDFYGIRVHSGYLDHTNNLISNGKRIKSLKKVNGDYVTLNELIGMAAKGNAHFTLVGHSMGGAVAQIYAIYLFNCGIPSSQIKGRTFNPALAITETPISGMFTDWYNICVTSDSVPRGLVFGSLNHYGLNRLGKTIWLYDNEADTAKANALSNIAENKHNMDARLLDILTDVRNANEFQYNSYVPVDDSLVFVTGKEKVPVYDRPKKDSDPSSYIEKEYTIVDVESYVINDVGNKWYRLKDGRFIYEKNLTAVEKQWTFSWEEKLVGSFTDYYITCEKAYLRSGFYEECDVLETLKMGDLITVDYAVFNTLGNCWYHAAANGKTGWIYSARAARGISKNINQIVARCPVNITLYDENDEVAASIIDGEIFSADDSAVLPYIMGRAKFFEIYDGKEYRAEIESQSFGMMSYEVKKDYDTEKGEFASVKEFSEIELSDNKKFESMTGGETGEVTFTETDSGDKANDSGKKQTETKNSKNTVLLIVVIVMILLIVIVIVFLILRYRSIKKSMDDKKIP